MFYEALDLYFAKAMMQLCDLSDDKALGQEGNVIHKKKIGASLCRFLSYHVRNEHVCLDLEKLPALEIWPTLKKEGEGLEQTFLSIAFLEPEEEYKMFLSGEYRDWLSLSPIVTIRPEEEIRPIVWEKNRIYLYRYYSYEREVAKFLLYLKNKPWDIKNIKEGKAIVEKLFLQSQTKFHTLSKNQDIESGGIRTVNGDDIDYQKLGVFMALGSSFFIISGGPGTGKTTTIAHFLSAFQSLYPQSRIVLTAPTGKATMRLKQSLYSLGKKENEIEVSTLQRLLGQSRDGLQYRYTQKNQLPFDLLIIDEASMLDLSLFAHTLRALSPETRCVLVGDHKQLASVNVGSVFHELCTLPTELNSTMIENISSFVSLGEDAFLRKGTSFLSNNMIVLKKNFRFETKSGIGVASQFIQEKNDEEALSILESNLYDDLYYEEGDMFSDTFQKIVIQEFTECFLSSAGEENTPQEILKRTKNFCILAPFRQGRQGIEALNRYISRILLDKAIVKERGGSIYPRPILVNANDYALELFNGDIGLVYQYEKEKQIEVAFMPFDQTQEAYRYFLLESLPNYEDSFAMTVHKSQGSEFDHVLFLLPEHTHTLLTRELFYTALTRAKKKISLLGSKKVLHSMLQNHTERHSGLGDYFL